MTFKDFRYKLSLRCDTFEAFYFTFRILWLIVGLNVINLDPLLSQGTFTLTKTLEDAYRDVSALKIEQGKQKLIHSDYVADENLMGYYIENYIDFFTLFIEEDQKLYKKLSPNRDIRLKIIQSGDSQSPYYLFCQAEIMLQWAIVKLKFNDKISAAKDIYEAHNLLVQNQKKFPDFAFNKKSLSIIHALAESIPSWVRKVLNIQGSIKLGTKEIEYLANYTTERNHIFKNEVISIYSYILFYANNQREAAFALFDKYNLDHRTNPLIAFLKATMAQKTGKTELAIKILEERPQSAAYLSFEYLDFLYGKFKLYRLDNDAETYLLRFVNNFKGRHYIKEAYQKLAWHSLITQNDKAQYIRYMNLCQKRGYSLIDEDKQALKEAQNGEIYDATLLKARLLYDGGYYKRANDLLVAQANVYINSVFEGEYYYRLGRIKDALKEDTEAIKYYNLAIIKSNPKKYFACNSALNTGIIYEKNKQYDKAAQYYNKCLKLNPEGYANSLHQKAKTGLERVKGY